MRAHPTTRDARTTLQDLRSRLDATDLRLLHELAERIRCCAEIAEVKRENGVPMMQQHRIDVVQRRAEEFGVRHGIDPGFLRRCYDLIIAEACRVEDGVIGSAPSA